MCLLINQRNNKPIKKEYLQTAYTCNNDGAGFSYARNGKLIINKYRNFNKFYKAYKTAVHSYGNESDFIIHFRLATNGVEKGVFNVHPFKISDKLVFAHNGVLDVKNHTKKSDTQVFNNFILKELPDNFLKSKAHIILLEGFIGSDKLVFLDNKGSSTIINEGRGHWNESNNTWYSNRSYKPREIYYNNNYAHFPYNNYKPHTNGINNYLDKLNTCKFCSEVKCTKQIKYHGLKINLCNTCKQYATK